MAYVWKVKFKNRMTGKWYDECLYITTSRNFQEIIDKNSCYQKFAKSIVTAEFLGEAIDIRSWFTREEIEQGKGVKHGDGV